MWTDAYIGLPFHPGGRGPAYDCLGLFLRLQRDRRGLSLPDPLCAMRDAAIDAAVLDARRGWKPVQHPEAGDAAVFKVAPHGLHIGYVIDPLHMLHIEGPEGAVIERLDVRAKRLEGYYRHV